MSRAPELEEQKVLEKEKKESTCFRRDRPGIRALLSLCVCVWAGVRMCAGSCARFSAAVAVTSSTNRNEQQQAVAAAAPPRSNKQQQTQHSAAKQRNAFRPTCASFCHLLTNDSIGTVFRGTFVGCGHFDHPLVDRTDRLSHFIFGAGASSSAEGPANQNMVVSITHPSPSPIS